GDVEAYPLSKRVQQVDEPLNVKDPYNEYGIACTGAQRCNRDQRQHRRDEISVSDLIGKRPRHSGANDGADKQRHAQDAGGVVQQQWLQRRTQRHGRKARRNIPPRDKNIHKKTSHELQTEDLEVPHSNPPSAAGFLSARTVPALIGFRVLSELAIALSSTSAQVLAIAMAPERRRGEALSLLAWRTASARASDLRRASPWLPRRATRVCSQ